MSQEQKNLSVWFYIRLFILLLLLCAALWARYTKYPPVAAVVNEIFGNGTDVVQLAPLTQEQLQNEFEAAIALESQGVLLRRTPDGAVIAADFNGKQISDEMAQYLAHLLRLKELNLKNTGLTTVQADVLGPMMELEKLNLDNCPISEKAFQTWSGFPFLKELSLVGTVVSSDGIDQLWKKCPRLSVLSVNNSQKKEAEAAVPAAEKPAESDSAQKELSQVIEEATPADEP